MTSQAGLRRWICACAAILFAAPPFAAAQDAPQNGWVVYVQEDPRQCWVVAPPTTSIATRDGQEVEVLRSEILMFITYVPGENRLGEVSFTGGYPFAEGSTVSMEIGSAAFEMFTEGEMAWAASPQQDSEIIGELRQGSELVLTAVSQRGTQTEDRFDLSGFTAAIEDAEVRCAP